MQVLMEAECVIEVIARVWCISSSPRRTLVQTGDGVSDTRARRFRTPTLESSLSCCVEETSTNTSDLFDNPSNPRLRCDDVQDDRIETKAAALAGVVQELLRRRHKQRQKSFHGSVLTCRSFGNLTSSLCVKHSVATPIRPRSTTHWLNERAVHRGTAEWSGVWLLPSSFSVERCCRLSWRFGPRTSRLTAKNLLAPTRQVAMRWVMWLLPGERPERSKTKSPTTKSLWTVTDAVGEPRLRASGAKISRTVELNGKCGSNSWFPIRVLPVVSIDCARGVRTLDQIRKQRISDESVRRHEEKEARADDCWGPAQKLTSRSANDVWWRPCSWKQSAGAFATLVNLARTTILLLTSTLTQRVACSDKIWSLGGCRMGTLVPHLCFCGTNSQLAANSASPSSPFSAAQQTTQSQTHPRCSPGILFTRHRELLAIKYWTLIPEVIMCAVLNKLFLFTTPW